MKHEIKRYFQPLDEWVYLKIYINPISSDLVIARYLIPLVNELCPALVENWFFLRYNDPDYHIRIRFWIGERKKIIKSMKIIKRHLAKAIEDGYVHKWVIDGYEREIERYGLANMILTEQYFCISSDFIARSLQYLPDNSYAVNCIGIWLMYTVLGRFLLSPDDRLELCRQNMQSYCKEYSIENMKGMNDSCRKYRKFTDMIDTEKELSAFPKEVANNMKNFHNRVGRFIEVVNESNINDLNISSLIHMDMNRLFNNNARKVEMVLYYILYKKYNSDIMRSRNK